MRITISSTARPKKPTTKIPKDNPYFPDLNQPPEDIIRDIKAGMKKLDKKIEQAGNRKQPTNKLDDWWGELQDALERFQPRRGLR